MTKCCTFKKGPRMSQRQCNAFDEKFAQALEAAQASNKILMIRVGKFDGYGFRDVSHTYTNHSMVIPQNYPIRGYDIYARENYEFAHNIPEAIALWHQENDAHFIRLQQQAYDELDANPRMKPFDFITEVYLTDVDDDKFHQTLNGRPNAFFLSVEHSRLQPIIRFTLDGVLNRACNRDSMEDLRARTENIQLESGRGRIPRYAYAY